MSPPDSSSAFLQSIMPAPVLARRSATCCAVMPVVFVAIAPFHSSEKRRPRAVEPGGGGRWFIRPSCLRLAPAHGFGRGRSLFRLHPGGDRLRFRPALAPSRPLLAVTIHIRFTRLGRVG